MTNAAQIAANSQTLRAAMKTTSVVELEALVRHHNARYWDDNAPEIDDPTFDALLEVLRDKAPNSKALRELGATKKVGKGGFDDIVHARPMLSLGG